MHTKRFERLANISNKEKCNRVLLFVLINDFKYYSRTVRVINVIEINHKSVTITSKEN